MDKYICINTQPTFDSDLTKYKLYEGVDSPADFIEISDNGEFIEVTNDIGIPFSYRKSRFITLSEWREQKINEILHD